MEKFYRLLYPMRVCLISSAYGRKEDVMPAAWVFPLSADPPYFGVCVTKKRHTYSLVRKRKAFGINTTGPRMRKLITQTGSSTGSKVDKFSEFKIKKEYGRLKVPLLKDSPVSIECRLVKEIELGDHILLVGEVVGVVKRREAKGLYQAEGYNFIEV